jgi:serine/threonine protein kinase
MLGQYKDDYEDINYIEEISETNNAKFYQAHNKLFNRNCILKVIDKKTLEDGDFDFLMEQINNEEKFTKICNSENTVNFYKRLDNKEYIIFELESCSEDLSHYMSENSELKHEKTFFKQIILDIAKALKTLHDKGIMHRDIKPSNIFIKNEDDNEEKKIVKLGDFGCSIYIKDNTSEPIGTIVYSAPEIIKNIEYDEKCDLWSLGVTLFELYFGVFPYGNNPTTSKINNIIYGNEEFLYNRSNIPTLDILFHRLLVINQKDRMTFDEFFNFVFKEGFMEEGVIFPEYKSLYENILKEIIVEYKIDITQEAEPTEAQKEKMNVDKILSLVEGEHLPDIMNFSNGSANGNNRFNNIIYYDENIDHLKSINLDSDVFERVTPGAFILCTSLKSLDLVKKEIVKQITRNKKMSFNLITTGSKCETIIEFLNKNTDFKNCIKKICVYCFNIKKWSYLKDKYEIVQDVVTNQKDVIKFINDFSLEEIKPYPVTKLLRYNDYKDKYKERHFKISQFYGDLTLEQYNNNIKKIKNIIQTESKSNELRNKNTNSLLTGFLTFDLTKDLELLDKLIIREYTKNTFYGDLNKWLMNNKMNDYEPIAYFTARLMYSLNKYAQKNKKFCIENQKELHRGVKMTYSNLLPYERAKGKIILLSAFTSTSQKEELALSWAGRENTQALYKTNLKFSVVFNIRNLCNNKLVSNGIDIQKESKYKNEEEILYQPFSFYYVRDVRIDNKNYLADIDLDTIGKNEILEEKIKEGKEIEFNQKLKIMEIKN